MLGFLWKVTYYPSRLISTSTPSIYKLPELCCSVSIDSCTMCARDMCTLVTIETCFISRKSQHLNKQQQNLLYLIHSSISHHYDNLLGYIVPRATMTQIECVFESLRGIVQNYSCTLAIYMTMSTATLSPLHSMSSSHILKCSQII